MLKAVFQFGNGFRQLGFKEACGFHFRRAHGLIFGFPAFHQAQGVPYFDTEIAALFAQLVVKKKVVSGGGAEQHAYTHAISAKFINEFKRIRRIAQRLAHFAALLVAHHAGEIHVFERFLSHKFVARHNHACHPEENDVPTRNQHCGGIVVVEFFFVFKSVEHRDGPQPAGEPGVHHIFVLLHVG